MSTAAHRGRRTLFALLALGALSGCKLHYQVDATAARGAVAFVLPDCPHRACLDSFEVRQRDGGVVWRLGKGATSPVCPTTFPIRYGVAPAGLIQTVAPVDLRAGAIYDITGSGSGAYSGAFKLLPSGEAINRWTEY